MGVCTAALQSEISEVTAVDVYQFCREVCSTRLINNGPAMLGRNGVVVQIDDSLYWEHAKSKLKKMKGYKHGFIPSYLDEFMMKDRYGGSSSAVFVSLLSDIATQSPKKSVVTAHFEFFERSVVVASLSLLVRPFFDPLLALLVCYSVKSLLRL